MTVLSRHVSRRRSFAAAFGALAVAVFAGCGGSGGGSGSGGQLATPTFGTLEVPDLSGSNNWTTFSTSSPPAEVLPTRGRQVRLYFYAPAGSVFIVSLRDLAGMTAATLAQNSGSNPPPEAGYFEILSENVSSNPAIYHMYVRAPLSLIDQANYDILVVNQSLRTDVTDSNPMVVPLRARKVYTVSVKVNGDGHVTSNPGGITCGTAPSGAALTQCSFDFGPGQVALNPNSNDSTVTRFKGWDGNCAPGVQSCQLTLDGSASSAATATFIARTNPATASSCSAAPTLPGLRWIDIPDCATGNIAGHPGISHPALCDANGYYCCEPGAATNNSPRCGGAGKIETPADCGRNAPRGLLRQPGGCYEVDSFP